MIKKLKTINPYDETEIDMEIGSVGNLVYENTPLIQKLNEVIDAVNVMQTQIAILEEHAHPTAKTPEDKGYIKLDNDSLQKFLKAHPKYNNNGVIEIPEKKQADPYAEQRKWIGKLCKFWDYDGEGKCFNILKEIGNPNTIQVWRNGAFRTSNGYWYKHCEPVKPDDDIIYKGGNNE